MKNYLAKILTIGVIMGSIISCTSKKDRTEDFEDRNAQFFKVVYLAQASRVIGSTNWVTVEGQHRLKFERADGQEESDSSGGDYTVQFSAYREAQLFNNGLCSGGYKGSFSLVETTASSTETDEEGPYNPLNTYNPDDGGTPQDDDDTTEVSKLVFIFTLAVSEKSLSQSCTSISPPDSGFSLRVIRFPNGDLIITNDQRNLEFYMIPEIVTQ